MAIYDDLIAIIRGNRWGPTGYDGPAGSSYPKHPWECPLGVDCDAPSLMVFLSVFGLVYAIWRIIAICAKKITGEWYRDRFLAILNSESQTEAQNGNQRSAGNALGKGKSERRVLSVTRALLAEEKIWHTGGGPASGDWSTIHDPPGASKAKEFLSRLRIPQAEKALGPAFQEKATFHGFPKGEKRGVYSRGCGAGC